MLTFWASKTTAVCESRMSWLVEIPVPDSVTFCGLPLALSAMLTVPALLPVVVGVNVTPMVQEVAGASWPTQLLARAKPVVMVTFVNVTMKFPVLVTVMVCWLLVVPVT